VAKVVVIYLLDIYLLNHLTIWDYFPTCSDFKYDVSWGGPGWTGGKTRPYEDLHLNNRGISSTKQQAR